MSRAHRNPDGWIRVSGVARWLGYTDVMLFPPGDAARFADHVEGDDPQLVDEVREALR